MPGAGGSKGRVPLMDPGKFANLAIFIAGIRSSRISVSVAPTRSYEKSATPPASSVIAATAPKAR